MLYTNQLKKNEAKKRTKLGRHSLHNDEIPLLINSRHSFDNVRSRESGNESDKAVNLATENSIGLIQMITYTTSTSNWTPFKANWTLQTNLMLLKSKVTYSKSK